MDVIIPARFQHRQMNGRINGSSSMGEYRAASRSRGRVGVTSFAAMSYNPERYPCPAACRGSRAPRRRPARPSCAIPPALGAPTSSLFMVPIEIAGSSARRPQQRTLGTSAVSAPSRSPTSSCSSGRVSASRLRLPPGGAGAAQDHKGARRCALSARPAGARW
jgi:hypothetical protein